MSDFYFTVRPLGDMGLSFRFPSSIPFLLIDWRLSFFRNSASCFLRDGFLMADALLESLTLFVY
jgi:hypothetical protein